MDMSNLDVNTLERFYKIVEESKNIVFFGGAGVSTESGIPDFRSKDGLYNQHDVRFEDYSPEYLLSQECLNDKPEIFFEFYRQKLDIRGIEPNITHKALAKLEEIGKLKAVVTQNIDGLHQKAGSKEVYEIHGTLNKNYCTECKKEYGSDFILNSEEAVPHCDCLFKGVIRPDVTLYGEQLPEKDTVKSVAAIAGADTLIVAGTSLSVYPASSLIDYFYGKHIVVINKEPVTVRLNEEDDLFIQGNMKDVFEGLMRHMGFEDIV